MKRSEYTCELKLWNTIPIPSSSHGTLCISLPHSNLAVDAMVGASGGKEADAQPGGSGGEDGDL
jgi:hypothetical protein